MYFDGRIWLAGGENRICLLPGMATRHGFLAGASETGKTLTQKVLVEAFSDMGVPVFLSDSKGDLSGFAAAGEMDSDIRSRIESLGIKDFCTRGYPVRFWDLCGDRGHPVRATVSEMGSLMLAGLLGLNETQSGVLNIIFRIADDRGLLLIDIKDLRAMLQYVGDHAADFRLTYGSIPIKSVGAIQRSLTFLEGQGSTSFFGEPSLDIADFFKTDESGRGYINILDSCGFVHKPALYSAFMLYLLSRLYETLPEFNDSDKPLFIFFIDEANMLFDGASKFMSGQIGQLMRLISERGAGIYFITDNPGRFPREVLDLLENRIQHAVKVVSSADKRLLQSTADLFDAGDDTDIGTEICRMKPDWAMFSLLDKEGLRGKAKKALVVPPQSKAGAVSDRVRRQVISRSSLSGKYDKCFDRESAYEILTVQERQARAMHEDRESEKDGRDGRRRSGTRQSPLEKATSAALSAIGREIGRTLVRGVLGSLKR